MQHPQSFETLFSFRLWKTDSGGDKGIYVVWFATPKNLAEGKYDDLPPEGLKGKRFEFYPYDDKKIDKFLTHLDEVAVKKVGVHQALAGAAEDKKKEVGGGKV
ncbi:MAG: hypothetical protein ACRETL_10485 [Gammaproteobacteria bacterium]